ncbi:MAG: hypothetical protein A3E01_02650 [Gammaproteobacteria bacterium RIFCSPHIGHO2_12_FULL_63_22]|nr:MAG: hypothetical protein A3E01_02650 [Gammaproteobacteria bacterium RIFCSPHIGHO2_12_FULL_63_22]
MLQCYFFLVAVDQIITFVYAPRLAIIAHSFPILPPQLIRRVRRRARGGIAVRLAVDWIVNDGEKGFPENRTAFRPGRPVAGDRSQPVALGKLVRHCQQLRDRRAGGGEFISQQNLFVDAISKSRTHHFQFSCQFVPLRAHVAVAEGGGFDGTEKITARTICSICRVAIQEHWITAR